LAAPDLHAPIETADGAGAVIFVGPSLSRSEARAVLPQATYLPPIAQGDLISILASAQGPRPWAVGIVDGVFYQALPVWHKEILFALEAGVRVYGASSMGALRAAECAPFGMVGVGDVFRRYEAGELTDDDEVAVAHAGPEEGWQVRSEPLVNVRATLEAAVASGRLSEETAAFVVAVAKQLWFPNRTVERILAGAAAAGFAQADIDAVRDALSDGYVDQKRLDAVALLETIAQAGDRRDTSRGDPVPLMRSGMFHAMFDRDRKVTSGETTIRREEIVRHVALSEPGFAELRDRAVDRLLLVELADLWKVGASPEDVEAARRRFLARRRLADDAALLRWAEDNDLSVEELEELITDEARIRRLRQWIDIAQSKRLLVGAVLTQLKLEGTYEASVAAAAEHGRAVASLGEEMLPEGSGPEAEELIRDQIRAGGWRPDVPAARFADEAGFHDVGDLFEELVRRRRIRERNRRALELLESLFEDGDGSAG
jgi:hypothetical protein